MSWRDQPRDRRGRWTTKGGGLIAVVVALVVGLGGAGGAGGTVGAGGGVAGGGTSAGRSVSGGHGGGARVQAKARSTARVVLRFESRGWRVTERGADADDDCGAHSYGQVHEFFLRQPCSALYRGLFVVRNGPVSVRVAVVWVDMPDATQALRLQQLVDRPGTGNLNELTKEGRRPTSTRWTGEQYASIRNDVTVVNAQAEPVGTTARAVGLARLAASAAVD